jgi:hypothetical protein
MGMTCVTQESVENACVVWWENLKEGYHIRPKTIAEH